MERDPKSFFPPTPTPCPFRGSFVADDPADRLRIRSQGFLGYVPAFGAAAAVPPVAVVLYSGNFSASVGALLLTYLVGECWPGPVMAVLQVSPTGFSTGTTADWTPRPGRWGTGVCGDWSVMLPSPVRDSSVKDLLRD